MVSIIFEISHALLVLVMRQKEKYLAYLENSLIDLQTHYVTGTGKVHALDDFTDSSILDMDKLREAGEVRRPVGFTADFGKTATAHYSTLPNMQHNRHAMAAFEQSQKVPFGFAPSASRSQQSASKPIPQPMGRAYAGLSALELLDKKALAKSKARGEVAECPCCDTRYTKHHAGQIFCKVQCKHDYNTMLEEAQRYT
jgi:hypothetical protein